MTSMMYLSTLFNALADISWQFWSACFGSNYPLRSPL